MYEMKDYSQEFKPDLKPEDFSKEMLAELLKMYGRLYRAVDGYWYLAAMDKMDEKAATDLDFLVWEKMAKYEIEKLTKLLNIVGDDIPAFMKYFQLSPWVMNLECRMEVYNARSGLLTVDRCYTLEALEREGKGRDNDFCRVVETKMFDMWAAAFNPNIRFVPVKLPPRKSKDEISCQWKAEII
jgi:hypothetical protein